MRTGRIWSLPIWRASTISGSRSCIESCMAETRLYAFVLGVVACFAFDAEPLAAQASLHTTATQQTLLAPGADSWSDGARGTIRGVTIGPIESALHPGRGYGSEAFERTLLEAKRLGSSWISLTPFARVNDLKSTGISLSFEAPFPDNRRAIVRAIRQAHALGLRVLIVPHLWFESGEWRGELNPGSDAAWDEWSRNYRAFLLTWADVARESQADMLSVGVELRRAIRGRSRRARSLGEARSVLAKADLLQ